MMMNQPSNLIWASTIDPITTMDAATWLETSRGLDKRNWHVTLIAYGDKPYQTRDGVNVLCFPNVPFYFVGKFVYHWQIIRHLLRHWRETDVVMFHQISALWLLPLRLLRMLGGRQRPLFVMDTRDMPDPADRDWRVSLHLTYYRVAHWLANRFADYQVAITDSMADYVDIPARQLLGTWPSGVVAETFAAAAAQRTWLAAGESIKLIYIGSMLEKRNLAQLCEAIILANEAGMAFALDLYGSGRDRERLEAIAAQSNGAIRICDPVAHSQVPGLLATAHIGVTSLPTAADRKYEASSPVKLFEYMASGLPMIATTNECHTAVVGNGRYVFWVEEVTPKGVLEALQHAWACRDELPKLSAEATAASDAWTWDAAAEKLSRALRAGLKGSSS